MGPLLGPLKPTGPMMGPLKSIGPGVIVPLCPPSRRPCKDHIVNGSSYYKYKILKISNIYNFELSKFIYNYHVKALSEIFRTYFLPIARVHNYSPRSKSNQNYFLNFVNRLPTVAGTLYNFMVFRFLQKLS